METPTYTVYGANKRWSPPISEFELFDLARRGVILPTTPITDQSNGQSFVAGEHPTMRVIFKNAGVTYKLEHTYTSRPVASASWTGYQIVGVIGLLCSLLFGIWIFHDNGNARPGEKTGLDLKSVMGLTIEQVDRTIGPPTFKYSDDANCVRFYEAPGKWEMQASFDQGRLNGVNVTLKQPRNSAEDALASVGYTTTPSDEPSAFVDYGDFQCKWWKVTEVAGIHYERFGAVKNKDSSGFDMVGVTLHSIYGRVLGGSRATGESDFDYYLAHQM